MPPRANSHFTISTGNASAVSIAVPNRERPARLRRRAIYDRRLVMAVQTTKRRILIVIALLAAGMLLFLAWLGGGPYTETWPTKFDPDRWKAASATWAGLDAHEDNTRCGMLMDLRVNVGISGKSRNELGHVDKG